MEDLILPVLQESSQGIDIALPDAETIEDTSYLKSRDITETITQKVVKTVLLDTSDNVVCPAYLIDFSGVGLIMQCVLEGLRSMIVADGDTGIYILNPNSDMILAGMGRKQDLYRVLEPFIESLFGDKVKIYINNGAGFKKIKKLAVDSVVLDI